MKTPLRGEFKAGSSGPGSSLDYRGVFAYYGVEEEAPEA